MPDSPLCVPGADIESTSRAESAKLAQRHRSALLRYFLRHLGKREDAEDLTQEVFARLARWQSPQPVGNSEALLFQIAANLLKDRYRRDHSHRAQQHLPIDECEPAELGEVPSVDCVYEQEERLRLFLGALDELPPKCRSVFLMQRYEGLTYSAVAHRLGISVSAVEKHMMNALLHLHERMELR